MQVSDRRPRARQAALFIVLVALGAAHWAWVFGLPPRIPRETADWPKEVRYYAVLQQAVTELRVPYFVSKPIQETRKFLALPETVISPQAVLLRWLDMDGFLLAHVVLLHAAATIGCLALRRRHALDMPSFVLLWLIVAFGGHIVAHISIGHSMWGGYFLLPIFLLWALDGDDGPAGRWPMAIGLTLGAMLLQGSLHVFVWCVLFLLVRLATGPARASVLAALAWSAGVGLFRLAPAAAILQGRRESDFQTGIPSLVELVQGVGWIRDVTARRLGSGSMGGLQWWEFDHYVGPAALVWLLAFGIPGFWRGAPRQKIAWPSLVLAVLSLDRLYAPIAALGLPLLSTQRVSARFLIVGLLSCAVVAAAESTRWAAVSARRRATLWIAAAVTALALAAHTHAWRMTRLEKLLPAPPHPRDARIEVVSLETEGPKDALYVAAVRGSGAISALVLAAALWRWRALSRGSSR